MELNAHMHFAVIHREHDAEAGGHDQITAEMTLEVAHDAYASAESLHDQMKALINLFMGQADLLSD